MSELIFHDKAEAIQHSITSKRGFTFQARDGHVVYVFDDRPSVRHKAYPGSHSTWVSKAQAIDVPAKRQAKRMPPERSLRVGTSAAVSIKASIHCDCGGYNAMCRHCMGTGLLG